MCQRFLIDSYTHTHTHIYVANTIYNLWCISPYCHNFKCDNYKIYINVLLLHVRPHLFNFAYKKDLRATT